MQGLHYITHHSINEGYSIQFFMGQRKNLSPWPELNQWIEVPPYQLVALEKIDMTRRPRSEVIYYIHMWHAPSGMTNFCATPPPFPSLPNASNRLQPLYCTEHYYYNILSWLGFLSLSFIIPLPLNCINCQFHLCTAWLQCHTILSVPGVSLLVFLHIATWYQTQF